MFIGEWTRARGRFVEPSLYGARWADFFELALPCDLGKLYTSAAN